MKMNEAKEKIEYNNHTYDVLKKHKENPTSDFIELKEFLILYISEFETQTQKFMQNQGNELRKRIEDLENTNENHSVKINSILDDTHIYKNKADQIGEIIFNNRKMNDQILSFDVRMNSLQKEFSNSCYKYDKIFLDNLIIPGTIGDYCKFKNLKEYLDYNTSQVQSLNNYKDKNLLDLKNYREKLEGLIATLTNQMDNHEKNLRKFTNKMIEETENNFKRQIDTIHDKIVETKMDNFKYLTQMKKKEEVVDGQKQILSSDEDQNICEISNLRKINQELSQNIINLKNEQEILKKKINEIYDVFKKTKDNIINFESTGIHFKKNTSKLASSSSKKLAIVKNKIDKTGQKDIINNLEEKIFVNPAESIIKKYIKGKEEQEAQKINSDLNEEEYFNGILKKDESNTEEVEENEKNDKKYFTDKKELNKNFACKKTNLKNSNYDKISLISREKYNYLENEIEKPSEKKKEEESNNFKFNQMLSFLNTDNKPNKNIDKSEEIHNYNSFSDESETNIKQKTKDKARTEKNLPNLQFSFKKLSENTDYNTTEISSLLNSNNRFIKDKEFNSLRENCNINNWFLEKFEKEEINKKQIVLNDLNVLISTQLNRNKEDLNKDKNILTICNIIKDLNEFTFLFKSEIIKKLGIHEQKINQLEYYYKKKLEELSNQIKLFIPINFNPYLKEFVDRKKIDTENINKNQKLNQEIGITNKIDNKLNYNINIVETDVLKMPFGSPFLSKNIDKNILKPQSTSSQNIKQIATSQILFNSKNQTKYDSSKIFNSSQNNENSVKNEKKKKSM